jgi:hypothetical protein
MKLVKSVQQAAFGLLFLATIPEAATANEAKAASTPVEDARAILIASDTEKMLNALFAQMLPVMESSYLGQLEQTEDGAEILKQVSEKYPGGQAAFGKRFGELMMASIRAEIPNIIEQTAQQYVLEIQPADLLMMRRFMESSAGKSMTAAQPKIQQKLTTVGQGVGAKAGVQAAMQLMVEAQKHLETPK